MHQNYIIIVSNVYYYCYIHIHIYIYYVYIVSHYAIATSSSPGASPLAGPLRSAAHLPHRLSASTGGGGSPAGAALAASKGRGASGPPVARGLEPELPQRPGASFLQPLEGDFGVRRRRRARNRWWKSSRALCRSARRGPARACWRM